MERAARVRKGPVPPAGPPPRHMLKLNRPIGQKSYGTAAPAEPPLGHMRGTAGPDEAVGRKKSYRTTAPAEPPLGQRSYGIAARDGPPCGQQSYRTPGAYRTPAPVTTLDIPPPGPVTPPAGPVTPPAGPAEAAGPKKSYGTTAPAEPPRGQRSYGTAAPDGPPCGQQSYGAAAPVTTPDTPPAGPVTPPAGPVTPPAGPAEAAGPKKSYCTAAPVTSPDRRLARSRSPPRSRHDIPEWCQERLKVAAVLAASDSNLRHYSTDSLILELYRRTFQT